MSQRSVLHIASKCVEEDISTFKYSIQDIVDQLEVGTQIYPQCIKAASTQLSYKCSCLRHNWASSVAAGNAENMPKPRTQGSGFTLALHPYQMQPFGVVRYADSHSSPIIRHVCLSRTILRAAI